MRTLNYDERATIDIALNMYLNHGIISKEELREILRYFDLLIPSWKEEKSPTVKHTRNVPFNWSVGDRFRWARGRIGKIETLRCAMSDMVIADVRWEDNARDVECNFPIVGGYYHCTKLLPDF